MASAGFWLGGNGVEEAAFYAYGYPSPADLAKRSVAPGEAKWTAPLGEFILPYATVCNSSDPAAAWGSFLQSTYEAVATEQGWDRKALEIPLGQSDRPYDVLACGSADDGNQILRVAR